MKFNSDINVLGSLPDWNLIQVFLSEDMSSIRNKGGVHLFTRIKTDKSVSRFRRAIKSTLLTCNVAEFDVIFKKLIIENGINDDTLFILFWNASANNDLFFHLNEKVFFPAYYAGRVSISKEEVIACIRELKETEINVGKWTDSTISTVAYKYLTLLKKFRLMEGNSVKKIVHQNLSDSIFVLLIYWLVAITAKPNLIDNKWLDYTLSEKQYFLDRLLQKKFSRFYNVIYTGDRLSIEPIIPYEKIYEYVNKL